MSASSRASTADTSGKTSEVPAPIFCVYNFKGGVGKTSTVINLASAARRTKREAGPRNGKGTNILIVDADPQCNLTGFFTRRRENTDQEDNSTPTGSDDEDDCVDAMRAWDGIVSDTIPRNTNNEDPGNMPDPDNHNLYSAILPSQLEGFVQLKPAQVVRVRDATQNFGTVHLLRGSDKMAEFETYLSSYENTPSIAPIAASIRRVAQLTAESVKADIIFIDLGPSSGSLNKIVTMTSDFIIPPTMFGIIPYLSTQALFKKVLPNFYQWREKALASQRLSDFNVPEEPPRVLPLLMQGYDMAQKTKKTTTGHTIHRKCSGLISNYEELVKEASVQDKIPFRSLLAIRAEEKDDHSPTLTEVHVVNICPQLTPKLLQLCQELKVSIIDLTKHWKHVKDKGSVKTAKEKVALAAVRWTSLATVLVKLTDQVR